LGVAVLTDDVVEEPGLRDSGERDRAAVVPDVIPRNRRRCAVVEVDTRAAVPGDERLRYEEAAVAVAGLDAPEPGTGDLEVPPDEVGPAVENQQAVAAIVGDRGVDDADARTRAASFRGRSDTDRRGARTAPEREQWVGAAVRTV